MFGTHYYKCSFIGEITVLLKFIKGRFLDYKDLVKLANIPLRNMQKSEKILSC